MTYKNSNPPELTKRELALYLGCECIIGDKDWKPSDIHPKDRVPYTDPNYGKPIRTILDLHTIQHFAHKTKPILRRLESMTEEEAWECWKLRTHNNRDQGVTNPKCAIVDRTFHANLPLEGWMPMVKYLLSKSFDLFGWIDAGLALDRATLND